MSRVSKKLTRKLSMLMDTTDDLCDVLTRYRSATADLITLIEGGGTMDESLGSFSSPIKRRREIDRNARRIRSGSPPGPIGNVLPRSRPGHEHQRHGSDTGDFTTARIPLGSRSEKRQLTQELVAVSSNRSPVTSTGWRSRGNGSEGRGSRLCRKTG